MPRYVTLTLDLTNKEYEKIQELINKDNHNSYTSLSTSDNGDFTFSPEHLELKITCTSEFAAEILSFWVKPLFPVKKYLFLKTTLGICQGVFQSTEEAEKVIGTHNLDKTVYQWFELDSYQNISILIGQDTRNTTFHKDIMKLFNTSNGWKPVTVTKFWE